jgi:hypothetical protein
MNIPKHVAGIALFVFIFGVSVLIAAIVAAPLQIIPPVPLNAPSPPSPTKLVSQPVSYKVQLVSLDFINREIYTTVTLKRERGTPAPEKLWVYTSFFVPEYPQKSWATAPVEVLEPFAGADEVTLTVTGDCPWCGDSSAPRAGYFARVNVSTASSADVVRSAEEQMDADIKTATQVLVQVERKGRR